MAALSDAHRAARSCVVQHIIASVKQSLFQENRDPLLCGRAIHDKYHAGKELRDILLRAVGGRTEERRERKE
jgi:hypothetical protein